MICHGARQPLHDQRQRERQQLRRLQRGNVERGADRGDLRIREDPQEARQPAAERVERFAGLQHRADRQQVLDHVRRTDAGQRALLVAAGTGVAILTIASAAARWNLRTAASSPATSRFRASAPAPPRIRAPARARRRGPAIARPAAATRGGSGPAAPENCLRPETAPAGGTTAAPDRRCAAAPPRRFRARSCAIARARRWRPRRPRRVRWRARTPASAAPATAAEAARDNPSAARSMSGSCARYACLCRADGKRVHRAS